TPVRYAEDRRLWLAERAFEQAWAMARGATRVDSGDRIGVFLGAESGRATLKTVLALVAAAGGGAEFDHLQFGEKARPLASRFESHVVSPATVATALARRLDARGPCQTISLACASGSAAILEAVRAIRLGACDLAVCGGVGADVD